MHCVENCGNYLLPYLDEGESSSYAQAAKPANRIPKESDTRQGLHRCHFCFLQVGKGSMSPDALNIPNGQNLNQSCSHGKGRVGIIILWQCQSPSVLWGVFPKHLPNRQSSSVLS